MDKIYQDSKDVYVSANVIYDKGDGKAYSDSGKTTQLTTSALKDAFLKGAIIFLNDESYAIPVSYSEASSIGSIAYIVPNAVTATSADIATLVAVADPE